MALRVMFSNKFNLINPLLKNSAAGQSRAMSSLFAPNSPKSKGFTWEGMKKKKEVLPLIFIIGGACVGLVGFIVYASQTRESVVYKKSTKTLAQSMDVLNPKTLKMLTYNEQYRPNAELDAIYKDMAAAEAQAE